MPDLPGAAAAVRRAHPVRPQLLRPLRVALPRQQFEGAPARTRAPELHLQEFLTGVIVACVASCPLNAVTLCPSSVC